LVRHKPPLEFQTANCCFRGMGIEGILDAFDAFVRNGKIKRAMSIPLMPDIVDIAGINSGVVAPAMNVALMIETMQPFGFDTTLNHLFLVAGDPGKGKSTVLASMAALMLRRGNARVYLLDSLSAGLYAVAGMENATNMDEVDDEYSFIDDIGAILDTRRRELSECRRSGGDLEGLKAAWEQIVFAIDNLAEFAENASVEMLGLLERIAKKEAGMKAAIWAAGNTTDISGAYDALVKAFKDAQCGILLGSLKDRALFNVAPPYGSFEKQEFDLCEGYLVIRNKYAEIKAAIDAELI